MEGTPFAEFPFNLGRSGKKSLWLVRQERDESFIDTVTASEGNLADEEFRSEIADIAEGQTITGLVSTEGSEKISKSSQYANNSAFGDITNLRFEDIYDLAKADIPISNQSVAILRPFDAAGKRWTECFLNSFDAPNMEDPICDGQFKTVFKNALFSPVFGNTPAVFKVGTDSQDDRLVVHSRAVQMAALCSAASEEFNSL